jgi:hypothetical protein
LAAVALLARGRVATRLGAAPTAATAVGDTATAVAFAVGELAFGARPVVGVRRRFAGHPRAFDAEARLAAELYAAGLDARQLAAVGVVRAEAAVANAVDPEVFEAFAPLVGHRRAWERGVAIDLGVAAGVGITISIAVSITVAVSITIAVSIAVAGVHAGVVAVTVAIAVATIAGRYGRTPAVIASAAKSPNAACGDEKKSEAVLHRP